MEKQMSLVLEVLSEVEQPFGLDMIWALQRSEFAERGITVSTLDLRGKRVEERDKALKGRKASPVILFRSPRDIREVSRLFPRSMGVLDAATREQLIPNPGAPFWARTEVMAYSDLLADKYRAAGAGRTRVLPGAACRMVGPEIPKAPTILVYPNSYARHALKEIIRVLSPQERSAIRFLSTEKFIGVDQVELDELLFFDFSAILFAHEQEDLGELDVAASLAASMGVALIAPNSESASSMGWNGTTFSRVAKYNQGGYAGAIRMYLEKRDMFQKGITPKYHPLVDRVEGLIRHELQIENKPAASDPQVRRRTATN
jgi:hypothetical protein